MAGYLLDPHTAVGVCAARKVALDPALPVVVLGTAHPAKFPDAVEAAAGVRPALPAGLSSLMTDPERFTVLPNDPATVARFVSERTRALRSGVTA
jgi:threonine synthase